MDKINPASLQTPRVELSIYDDGKNNMIVRWDRFAFLGLRTKKKNLIYRINIPMTTAVAVAVMMMKPILKRQMMN